MIIRAWVLLLIVTLKHVVLCADHTTRMHFTGTANVSDPNTRHACNEHCRAQPMFYMMSPPPLVGLNSPVQPHKQMLGSLLKPTSVVSQSATPLQQLFHYPADLYFVDGFNVEPS